MQIGQDYSSGGRKNLRDSLLGAGALQEDSYSRNHKKSFNNFSIRKDSQRFMASRNQTNLKGTALNDGTKYSYVSRQENQYRDSDFASESRDHQYNPPSTLDGDKNFMQKNSYMRNDNQSFNRGEIHSQRYNPIQQFDDPSLHPPFHDGCIQEEKHDHSDYSSQEPAEVSFRIDDQRIPPSVKEPCNELLTTEFDMLQLLSEKVEALFERPKSALHSEPCSNTRKISLVLKPILHQENKDEWPLSQDGHDSMA